MGSSNVGLVCDFVNTLLLESGFDFFASPRGLGEWLQSRSLLAPSAEASIEDVARITEVREAIRNLIGANTGTPISPTALEVLGRAARMSPLFVAFSPEGVGALAPSSSDVEGAVADILLAVVMGMAGSFWNRVKLCRNPQCRRAFYDRSRNRSGVWCRVAGCGNRAKVRAYRLRKRHAGP